VEIHEHVDLEASPSRVFPWVDDLARYPSWLGIVSRVEPAGELTWSVDLRGRVGPFARSKRLRMRRTVAEPHRLVVFERHEDDGRDHSTWVLRATLEPLEDDGTHLTVHLAYGGALWGPVLERVLREEIGRAKKRLQVLVEGDEPSTAQAP
jgi:uncharacterized protein YndB with AHSA1/START domain